MRLVLPPTGSGGLWAEHIGVVGAAEGCCLGPCPKGTASPRSGLVGSSPEIEPPGA